MTTAATATTAAAAAAAAATAAVDKTVALQDDAAAAAEEAAAAAAEQGLDGAGVKALVAGKATAMMAKVQAAVTSFPLRLGSSGGAAGSDNGAAASSNPSSNPSPKAGPELSLAVLPRMGGGSGGGFAGVSAQNSSGAGGSGGFPSLGASRFARARVAFGRWVRSSPRGSLLPECGSGGRTPWSMHVLCVTQEGRAR